MSKTNMTVKSPVALDNGQLERIEKVVSKIISEDVVVKNEIDEKMLGGIRLIFGTKSIDLSLEDMIKEIEEELNE